MTSNSESEPLSTDELLEQFGRDDLEDKLAEVEIATPRDYAKMRRVAPQLVYYYIRSGKLNTQICDCGRRCIPIKEADELFDRIEEKRKAKQKGN